jgi:hypothetical protein
MNDAESEFVKGIQETEKSPAYKVTIPTMKSLYIEMYFEDELLSCGTAFLVANDRDSHCALITNRHNVTGRNQDTGEPLHKYGGIPDNIIIYFHKNSELINGEWKKIKLPLYRDDGTPFWIEHPRLGGKADLVALNLKWGSDVSRYPYYLKSDLDSFSISIGPAETISVIGFPFGLSSIERFPIWATGFTAQELSLVTPENPVFIIDCRTRRGQSGSAVIAYRPGSYQYEKEGKVYSGMGGVRWEFLGIYSGRINAESDLGRVWHKSAVQEVLDAAEERYSKKP